ncbi:pleckstrin homology domain-containing family G member 4B-like [Anguilla rostrata]|uniref:pleckstrin homology domain-containing family G member 4B-like n=1 Tax=Anguilla rostrata TaxID=7938 RepID=UPI0030D340AF
MCTAQLIAGLLIISLGLLVPDTFLYTLPSVLFIISGLLSYAAGHSPNISLTKLSFSLNIISLFWATAALVICLYKLTSPPWSETENGIQGMTAVLIALELVVALILIYWESKAVCRDHFNILDKQVELGDKMDLASYLLKPIQRMSKYALLLKDLIKECGHTHEQELSDLRTAEEMVKFQLRHGNDLLAMDAIRVCDVNLKAGTVRCQENSCLCGRRNVFLFEDLILFSKTKKIDGGYDIYIYKQCYKVLRA